jgi:competence protein ComEA
VPGVERSPITIVVWLLAAVLVAIAGTRWIGAGDGASGAHPVRLASEAEAPSGAAIDGRGGDGSGDGGSSGGGLRARSTSSEVLAYVHVAGAVRSPGLYRVAQGARVATAVKRAGGTLPRADLAGINLAARVQDGQQIVVPRVGVGDPGLRGLESSAGGAAGGASAVKPSLGSASAEQLDGLDGIGPTLAKRIVEYRTAHGGFHSIDQLGEVEGIGAKRLASLRDALQP